ncbi:hypothetical protein [Paludibaculum fermentans]|uniref:DoxX family protein n=1 Tax=Paludibaculum fermentans TaxID=1473598 RepID=A0A7S7SII6_PALFE|nr:hypothetical protein [Paludibaculum fermentans]QOY87067.1 hypothetical protein IRI77_30520 [Paludibaculum fermentans]
MSTHGLLPPLPYFRRARAPNPRDAMSLRAWARILIAASFFISGLAETLSATGFVIEVSPKANWDSDAHTLALGGVVQMTAAAMLVLGRKTHWALAALIAYLTLGSIFCILPRFFTPDAAGSPIASLLSNMAVIGGLLHWLHLERAPQEKEWAGRSGISSHGKSNSSPWD